MVMYEDEYGKVAPILFSEDANGNIITSVSISSLQERTATDEFIEKATEIADGYMMGYSTTMFAKFAGAKLKPQGKTKPWGSTDNLINSANTAVKGNNTAVGRAFQKHTVREGTAFTGEVTGNAAKNTEQGMGYLNKILNDPNATFNIRNTKAYGDVLDVRLPDGMGARWSFDGKTFIGFLERFTSN